MTVRYSPQGCKIETTFTILTENGTPTGMVHEHLTLSVDPASALTLALDECKGKSLPVPQEPRNMRMRATKFGFELVPR